MSMTDALLTALTEQHAERTWPHYPHWFCMLDGNTPTMGEIKRTVAKHYCISERDMMSARRSKDVVLARHVAIYLSKKLTLCSMPQIGASFNRVHTVTIYAVRGVERRINSDKAFAAEVAKLEGIFA